MAWIRFTLIEMPVYDKDGNPLKDITGRKNRMGVDEILGGGKVHPDFGKVRMVERYQNGADLLVLVDGDDKEVEKLLSGEAVEFMATPKYIKYIDAGFKPVLVTDAQAIEIKETVFGIKVVESGVTK